jgi:eukaryotic-like serine/threonine-protein kinase
MEPEMMNAESLFHRALELEPQARAAFLTSACGSNAALRLRVDALLAAHEQGQGFLPSHSTHEDGSVHTVVVPRLSSEQAGALIGRYKLLEQIGEGGFGTVWAAEQREPVRRRVALKIIKLGMDSKQVVARFEAERQALALMDHPNIARVLDAGATEAGRPYFVMELIKGIPITKYCDQEKLRTEERLELFIKVCQAIQHAHQKGIIHRDIKPSNILVTLHDGVPVPKVIDFGIAKATQAELTELTIYTQHQQFIGTPAYMSPEQAEMSGLDIDTRSDIYSLGVLLYELITGSTPFDTTELLQSGLDEMRRIIREREPLRPSTRLIQLEQASQSTIQNRKSKIKNDLDWIVMKCLEKDRTRRYATANGLAMDIQRHLNNEPVVARPPSAVYRFQKTFRRNKLVFAAGTVVAIALVIGLGAASVMFVRERAARSDERQQRIAAQAAQQAAEAERQRAETERQRANEEMATAQRILYAADMNLVRQALDLGNLGRARRLLDRHRPAPGQTDLRHWEWRHLWLLAQGDEQAALGPFDHNVFTVDFSPDRAKLLVADGRGQVTIWDLANRSMEAEWRLPSRWAKAVFSPSGDRFVMASGDGPVRQIEYPSLRELPDLDVAPDAEALFTRHLTFSPDGSKLAVYVDCLRDGEPHLEVQVWELAGPSIFARFPAAPITGHFGTSAFSPDGRRLVFGGRDGVLHCQDLTTTNRVFSVTAHDGGISALAWSPDGRWIASGAGYSDTTIRLLDARDGSETGQLEGHAGWISSLVFAPGGDLLVSGSADQTTRLWDVETRQVERVFRGHTDEVYTVAISRDGQTLASGSKSGMVHLYETQTKPRPPTYLSRRVDGPKSFHFSGDGTRVLALDLDRTLVIFDSQTLEIQERLPELGTNVVAAFFAPGDRSVLGSSAEPELRAWRYDLVERRVVREWTGERVLGVNVADRRFTTRFTTGVRHRESDAFIYTTRCRDIESGMVLWQRESPVLQGVSSGAIAPDGKVVAYGRQSGQLTLFHANQDHLVPVQELAGHRRVVGGLDISQDGRWLASGSEGGTAFVWDLASGGVVANLHGHLEGVHSVRFSDDDQRVATGSGGTELIKLWDPVTGQEVLTLSAHGSLVGSIQFSNDGRLLGAVSWNEARPVLHLWFAPTLDEIAQLEQDR